MEVRHWAAGTQHALPIPRLCGAAKPCRGTFCPACLCPTSPAPPRGARVGSRTHPDLRGVALPSPLPLEFGHKVKKLKKKTNQKPPLHIMERKYFCQFLFFYNYVVCRLIKRFQMEIVPCEAPSQAVLASGTEGLQGALWGVGAELGRDTGSLGCIGHPIPALGRWRP